MQMAAHVVHGAAAALTTPRKMGTRRLVEETEAHVVVRLLLLLLLLLLLFRCLSGSGSTTSCWCSSRCGTSATGTNIREELLDVLALEGLCEEGCPYGLQFNVCRSRQSGDFVGL